MKVDLTTHGKPGKLIAICGTDGTGKSTTIELLKDVLRESGVPNDSIVQLAQPTSWWREDARALRTILHKGDGDIADEVAIGVFGVADRINQQALEIGPALDAGKTVIMDRYIFSMLTYYMGNGEPQLPYLTSICRPLFRPDLIVVMDCPPEIAVERVIKRDGENSKRYDQQIGATTRITEAFRAVARDNGLYLLSSLQTSDEIRENLRRAVQEIDQKRLS